MFHWIAKIIISTSVFLGITSPTVSPAPIIDSVPTPTAEVSPQTIPKIMPKEIPKFQTPTPTPLENNWLQQFKNTEQEGEKLFGISTSTPMPAAIDFCRNIPNNQTEIPRGMYRSVDSDCFTRPPEPATTPTPKSTPAQIPILVTDTPTPISTPEPEPIAKSIEFVLANKDVIRVDILPLRANVHLTSLTFELLGVYDNPMLLFYKEAEYINKPLNTFPYKHVFSTPIELRNLPIIGLVIRDGISETNLPYRILSVETKEDIFINGLPINSQ